MRKAREYTSPPMQGWLGAFVPPAYSTAAPFGDPHPAAEVSRRSHPSEWSSAGLWTRTPHSPRPPQQSHVGSSQAGLPPRAQESRTFHRKPPPPNKQAKPRDHHHNSIEARKRGASTPQEREPPTVGYLRIILRFLDPAPPLCYKGAAYGEPIRPPPRH